MKTILRLAWIGILCGRLLTLPAQAALTRYAYDDAGRLLQADYGGGSRIEYTYDANGNVLLRSASDGAEYLLIYSATAGGSILGAATQTVAHGGSGTPVSAVTNLHHRFAQWSDGKANASRTDTHVTANLNVVARFAALLAAQGTPIWWLDRFGLTAGGALTFDQAEAGNPDNDPFTSGDEYVADTDPTNALSRFRIVAVDPGPPVTVEFDPGSARRVYNLQTVADLAADAWTNVPGQGPRPGAGGVDAMADTNAAPLRFYRVEVVVPQ